MLNFMDILTGVGLAVIAVLLFELIIFFHEGGHFVSAKLSGVKVNEFALGMGPKLFSFKIKDTVYSLRLFPIGGFCAMEGEDKDSENPHAFNNAKIWKRMIIIIAGAVMNIILGFVFMAIIIAPNNQFSSTEISGFSPNSFSASSGLMAGDKIANIHGYEIYNSMDMSYALSKIKVTDADGKDFQIYKQDCCNAVYNQYVQLVYSEDAEIDTELNQKLYEVVLKTSEKINKTATEKEAFACVQEGIEDLSVLVPEYTFSVDAIKPKEIRKRFRTNMDVYRGGERITLENVDFYTYTTADDDTPKMGIDFYVTPVEKNLFTYVGETCSQTVSVVRMVYDSLWGLIQGEFSFNDMSGPVGIASVTVEMAQQGLKSGFGDAVLNILYIMMIITINLGIVNMLPFPALDGGRFLFLMIEWIFKKPIPRKVEAYINAAGLILLLLLTAVITFKDIWKLFV